MKIRDALKRVIKQDGRCSFSSRTINKLKSSKEFSYLVDTKRV